MFDEDWRILYTPCGNFIGRVTKDDGKKATLEPAFSWINESVQMQGGMGIIRQAVPIQATMDSSKLEIEYVGQQVLKDWEEHVRKETMNQISQVIDGMIEMGASKAGIELPKKQGIIV